MQIALVADHNGATLKTHLIGWLTAHGHRVDDRTPDVAADQTLDYPGLCADVCGQVQTGQADRAMVLGGTGAGETIACNKLPGIRAGLCHDPLTAEISRAHNDANVLVLGAKVVDVEQAEELADIWLRTAFKGGRHQQRLDQIAALERGESLS